MKPHSLRLGPDCRRSTVVPRRNRCLRLLNLALGAWTALMAGTAFAAATPLTVRVTGLTSNSVSLAWTGGRPDYRLQSRATLDDPWVNEGPVTSTTSAVMTRDGGTRFYRVVSDYTAQYEVVFNAVWSNQTHPGSYPSGAHWSGLVGGVHNTNVAFWNVGATATEGIRQMAELGSQSPLIGEVNAAINGGTAHFSLRGGGLGNGSGTVTYRFPQRMTREFPRVTLCSMAAPSPDWFVGVSGLSLLEEDGEWAAERVVTLFAHDAGTDSGSNYTSLDQVTVPRGVITRHAGYPALINGQIVPFGTFTFRRLN